MVWTTVFGDLTAIPNSTLLVVAMALGVSVLFSVGRRYLTDVKWTKRAQTELKDYNKELREAIKNRNKPKEEKMLKKKRQMDAMQAKLMMSNMKVSLLFMVPLMALWWLVSGIVGYETHVAVSPIPMYLPVIGAVGPELNLFWWYMIASFAMSGIVTKATGTSLSD